MVSGQWPAVDNLLTCDFPVVDVATMELTKITIDKDDFIEFLSQAAEAGSLTFSTNPAGEVWPCEGDGRSKDAQRRYIETPTYLLKTAKAAYLEWREKGGRFRIDFFGVYCHVARCYLISMDQVTGFGALSDFDAYAI